MGSLTDTEVLVQDVGVDAAVVETAERTVLILRPAMSFGAAVRAVTAVLPYVTVDEAAALVRASLPVVIDLDALLAS
jgi:hypothetical protein